MRVVRIRALPSWPLRDINNTSVGGGHRAGCALKPEHGGWKDSNCRTGIVEPTMAE